MLGIQWVEEWERRVSISNEELVWFDHHFSPQNKKVNSMSSVVSPMHSGIRLFGNVSMVSHGQRTSVGIKKKKRGRGERKTINTSVLYGQCNKETSGAIFITNPNQRKVLQRKQDMGSSRMKQKRFLQPHSRGHISFTTCTSITQCVFFLLSCMVKDENETSVSLRS